MKHLLLASFILAQLVYVNCFAWAVVSIATAALGTIINIIDKTQVWTVEVHNQGKHHAHMWCASADDRIGGRDGVWVKPGDKIMWSFRRNRNTQFWCTMDWYGQRVGWDVFVTNWKDAPNPTKWSIKNDGVYDQWRNLCVEWYSTGCPFWEPSVRSVVNCEDVSWKRSPVRRSAVRRCDVINMCMKRGVGFVEHIGCKTFDEIIEFFYFEVASNCLIPDHCGGVEYGPESGGLNNGIKA